jgi:hypothetical protein
MIPMIELCAEGANATCPRLFDDLEALRAASDGAVRAAVDVPVGENLESFVSLDPVAFGEGNYVAVVMENMTRAASKGMHRTRVRAQVYGVFAGYPTIESSDEGVFLPAAAAYHEAAKWILGLGFCVWCRLVEGSAAGNLLSVPHTDVELGAMEGLDFDGGQAGFKIPVSWYL